MTAAQVHPISTMPRRSSEHRIRLVYLLAASHSGSTLLAMLLGSHPDAFTVGELKLNSLGDTAQYLCSCRRRIGECSFWKEVICDLDSQGLQFSIESPGTDLQWRATSYIKRLLRPLHRGSALESLRDWALNLSPAWRGNLPEIKKRNLLLLNTIARLSGRRVIVDSSKVALRLKYLLRIPEIEIRVVRLIRDGRAVSLTYMDPAGFADSANPSLRGGGNGSGRDSERLPMAAAAREWRRSNEEAESLLAGLDRSSWTLVRYEDLCAQPAATMKRLFQFLKLDPDRVPDNFRSWDHHVLGNGMRLDDRSEIRLDDRWRSVLTGNDLKEFEREAGALNRKLGYQ